MPEATALQAKEPTLRQRRVRRLAPSTDWHRQYALSVAAADCLAMVVAVLTAQAVRLGAVGISDRSTSRLSFGVVGLVATCGWMLTMALKGAYNRRSLGTGSEEYRRVVDASLLFLAMVAIVSLLFHLNLSRAFVAIAIPVAGSASLVMRYLLRKRLHHQRGRGCFTRSVLVVGSPDDATELIRCMRSSAHAGLSAVGACVPGEIDALYFDGESVPVVAGPQGVLEAVIASRADAVAIADTTTLSNGNLRRLAWGLEGTGVDLMVTPAVTDLAGPRISVRPVSDLPLLHVEEPELNGLRRLTKEAVDRLVAGVGLVVLSPLLLAAWAAVRLTSRGPAIFRQARVGLGGRHFVMYKFRTMIDGAEAHLPDLSHLNEHDGILFKIRHDPRITPVGRFLRRWSVDELPQLWNVLRGDMSIVGPRPPLPTEVERYSQSVRRRLLVKPGLTGLWQVSGRSGLSWEESVRLDLHYVENWSLSMDVMIIARTVTAVARRQGAC